MRKAILLALALLFSSSTAYAFQCETSQALGFGDKCTVMVTIASNETTLVSQGSVLVYDVQNIQEVVSRIPAQVRVTDLSADGVFVAGVAQARVASGNQAMVVVRGRTLVATKALNPITSGNALFVSTSGDSTTATSTTQTQLGFALEDQAVAATTDSRATIEAFITIV